VVFLVAATGFFGAIQVALDEVWRTTEKPGFMTTVFLRLKSFAVIAGASIVLVAMVALTTVASTVGSHALSKALSVVIMLVVSTGLFAVLYKWLPRTPIGWKDVIGGSFVTAVLAVIGQYGIGMYLGRASTTSIYGAAGSLAAIMLWLYYTATIFLIGAELIKAYAENSKVS
jgi:membrane protein